jgi:hypothetical protein
VEYFPHLLPSHVCLFWPGRGTSGLEARSRLLDVLDWVWGTGEWEGRYVWERGEGKDIWEEWQGRGGKDIGI